MTVREIGVAYTGEHYDEDIYYARWREGGAGLSTVGVWGFPDFDTSAAPSFALAGDEVYLAWVPQGDRKAVAVARLTEGGLRDVRTVRLGATLGSRDLCLQGVSLAFHPGREWLYCAYTFSGLPEVRMATFDTVGREWLAPPEPGFPDPPVHPEILTLSPPALTVDDDHTLVLAWRGAWLSPGLPDGQVYTARLRDGERTWATRPIRVAAPHPPVHSDQSPALCHCPKNGLLYLAYKGMGTDRGLHVLASPDLGTTWWAHSAEQGLSVFAPSAGETPTTGLGPALGCTRRGDVVLAWVDDRGGGVHVGAVEGRGLGSMVVTLPWDAATPPRTHWPATLFVR